ncbi:MAG: hypothetical protein IIT52_00290 [Candidatus Methanomethylophilus sp.]|nr:hypothetical protein [Methanomethylophilus sp.]
MKTTLTTVLPLVGVGQNPGSSILGLLESLRSGIVADQLGGITGIAVAGGALIAAVVLLKIANDYMQGQGITLWSVIRPVVLLMLIMNELFYNWVTTKFGPWGTGVKYFFQRLLGGLSLPIP